MTRRERREALESYAVQLTGELFTCPDGCPNARYKVLATKLYRELKTAYAALDKRRQVRGVATTRRRAA